MNFFLRTLFVIYAIRSFFQRKVFLKHIKKSDLVLDIGSGDKPFWRADVFVDKYPEDDQQRFSGSVIYDKKKMFVNADVENLPFKDKTFDFVICSHLLEHVEHPDKALQEIARVGKCGYIEVPRAILDALAPFPPHLWFCETEGNTLIFRRKETRKNFYLSTVEKFGSKYFYTPLLQYLFVKDIDAGFICYYWKNKVRFRVEYARSSPYIYAYSPEKQHTKSLSLTVSRIIYKIFYLVMNMLYYQEKDINMKSLVQKVGHRNS